MPRGSKAPIGPSRLTKILAQLRAGPKYSLPGLRSLKLTYAFRNDHFGARHFVKEALPKIRFDNPNLQIDVDKPLKTKEEHWKPEMELKFENGSRTLIDLNNKWSTTILKELMDTSGGEPWKKWKKTAESQGLAVVPGEENEANVTPAPSNSKLPSYEVFRANNPMKPKPKAAKTSSLDNAATAKPTAKKVKGAKVEGPPPVEELKLDPTKTGAAAVLP